MQATLGMGSFQTVREPVLLALYLKSKFNKELSASAMLISAKVMYYVDMPAAAYSTSADISTTSSPGWKT